jgi:hypothetical protein
MSATSGGEITPFSQFFEQVRTARFEEYRHRVGSVIQDEASFNEMRSYLLHYYAEVVPVVSFADANSAVFDYIPIDQQISRRDQTAPVAAPPEPPAGGKIPGSLPLQQFNNAGPVPAGTVPVRRITLEDLMRFATLDQFLRKNRYRAENPDWR